MIGSKSLSIFALVMCTVACGSQPATEKAASPAGTPVAATQPTAAAPQEFAHLEKAAWERMHGTLMDYFSEDAASHLIFMAYHSVAEDLCGMTLDMAKFKAAAEALYPENWKELAEKDRTAWNQKFLLNYGMAVGVLLAEHTHETAAFCGEAKSFASDPEGGSYFTALTTKS